MKAIQNQHQIHIDDAAKKRAENTDKLKKLEADYQRESARLMRAIDVAAAGDPAAAAAAKATPVQACQQTMPEPVEAFVVTANQVNPATIWEDIVGNPHLGVQNKEQAEALTTFFIKHLQDRAVVANVAAATPTTTPTATTRPPAAKDAAGDAVQVQVPGGDADGDAPMSAEELENLENKRLEEELNEPPGKRRC